MYCPMRRLLNNGLGTETKKYIKNVILEETTTIRMVIVVTVPSMDQVDPNHANQIFL